MTDDPARWQRLESIVAAALSRAAEERPVFLDDACRGDADLRRDAASLLERESRAEGFLTQPLDALAATEQGRGPALMIGQTIAHYRVVKAIGAGGMGEVYLAEDTRLGRQIALKILPSELAIDDSRRIRFAREAKAVAALNHPNIVTVHAVEEADGLHFITMELVRGHTLAERLPQTGFALGSFFEIAIPLAAAIAAAHQQGITHRDLKPTNVMLTDEGRVKVLDFGLAKAQLDVWNHEETRALRSATEDGRIVGTPAYMSPEQAEGKKVDPRSDIFSLGIVCYEMLTGERPFGGDNPTQVLSSIVRDTPRPLSEIKPAIPRRLASLVHRCLEKNPLDRYQSAIDLRHDLEETKRDEASGATSASPTSPSGGRRRGMAIAWGLAAVIAATGAASIWLFGSRGGVGAEAVPGLQNAIQVTSALTIESYPTWSPEGQRLAYEVAEFGFQSIVNADIWVAQLGSGEPVNLTQGSLANDRRPSWSPVGHDIAFFSNRDGDWGVYLVAAIGGSPRKVLALPSFDSTSWSAPQWSKDGTTLFVMTHEANRNVVVVLSLESLQATRVMLPEHSSPRTWDLAVRADGRRFAYVEAGGGFPEVSRLWTIAASGGDPIPLSDGHTKIWSPTWSADGRKVFYVSNRGGSMDLWQQAVGTDGAPIGEPLSVTQGGLGITSAVFSVDGRKLAYAKGGRVSNVWRVPIPSDRRATWADATRVTSERAYIEFIDVSPDGKQLAVSSDRRGNQDLWILPSAGGEMMPLTNDPTPDWNPRWSPNGREIAFYAYRSGNRDLWVMPSSGGPARQLTSKPGFDWYPSWSPDGSEIAFATESPATIAITSAAGGEPRLLTAGMQPAWSPNGQWLVFVQNGRLFRVARDGQKRSPLPTPHRPNAPRFSRDGQAIYFSVNEGPNENHGIWRLLLRDGTTTKMTQLENRRGAHGYYFSADDRYFYFTWREDESDIWVTTVAPADAK